ncbi:MAG: hypothetical protein ACK6C0_10590 [Betaproteobacteria bacterium]
MGAGAARGWAVGTAAWGASGGLDGLISTCKLPIDKLGASLVPRSADSDTAAVGVATGGG